MGDYADFHVAFADVNPSTLCMASRYPISSSSTISLTAASPRIVPKPCPALQVSTQRRAANGRLPSWLRCAGAGRLSRSSPAPSNEGRLRARHAVSVGDSAAQHEQAAEELTDSAVMTTGGQ